MFGQFKKLFSSPVAKGANHHEALPNHDGEPAVATVCPLSGVEEEYCSWLLGVNSPLETPLNDFERRVLDSVDEQMESIEEVCNALPRLPDVLPKLMRALRDERTSWEEIARIVGQDATLVAEVLRLANSPCFRVGTQITCLEQVVMQLGLVGLREVVVTVSLKPILKFDAGHYFRHVGRKIWVQALAAAVASRSLAMSRGQSRFEAYLAGLVHNVGMVVVMQTLQRLSQGDEAPRSLRFRGEIQRRMRRISCLIAGQWQLPEATLEALAEQVEPAGGFSGPLGEDLQHGIWLAMLHALVLEGRIADGSPYLRSLPEGRRPACERALAEIETHAGDL